MTPTDADVVPPHPVGHIGAPDELALPGAEVG